MFTEISFVSERLSSSTSLQYFELLPSLGDLVTYIQKKLCPKGFKACLQEAARIGTAHCVDVDYDTTSQSLTLRTYHGPAVSSELDKTPRVWDEKITEYAGSVATEIGILNEEVATEPEELSLGGFLVTLGKDVKPSKHHNCCIF